MHPMKSTESRLIDKTIHLWKHRTGEAISREDAKDMANNIAGFFRVLLEWDHKIYGEGHHQEKIMELHVNKKIHKKEHHGDEVKCPTVG